jgi:glycosyltransferase involved in cell wall biosynthesis
MSIVVLSANTCWYIYNFRQNTIAALINKGFHVCIVAPRDSHTEKLKKLGIQYIPINFDQQSKNVFTEILIILKFFHIYKKLKPKIVLNFTPKNNIYGSMACKALDIPVVNNISGLGTIFINQGITASIVRILYRISQSRADFIFFQNTSDRNLLWSLGAIKKIPSKLIPGSGVDLEKFTFTYSRCSEVTKFLLCSRMLEEKGVLQYLEAAKKIWPDYRGKVEFRLLGPVDLKSPSAISSSDMKNWHKSGVVRYQGFTDDVLPELVAVDCVVLPSFYGEGIPKSLIEAAAAGKPIITADNVGCREVVQNNNGYLCKPRSVESLELAMRKFLKLSKSQKYEMGKRSRIMAEQSFDEKIVIEAYLDVVEDYILK